MRLIQVLRKKRLKDKKNHMSLKMIPVLVQYQFMKMRLFTGHTLKNPKNFSMMKQMKMWELESEI